MTIADRLKPLARRIRSIPGKPFGIRPYTVSVRVRAKDGEHGLRGAATDAQGAIVEANGQPPKVRFLREDELALSGLTAGSIEVGPITPQSSAGGLSFDVLTGANAANQNLVHYIVTGPEFPNGAEFRKVGQKSDRALHYMLTLSPVANAS